MRPRKNPHSPWNPDRAAEVTPEEYERQVVVWIRATGARLASFDVQHLRRLSGAGGEYEFDAVAELSVLEGAKITLLIECKRYSSPVEREALLSLWAKLQDVKAHKAMIFATCGFQSGALEYAAKYGIAAVTFVNGDFLYETRSLGEEEPEPPPWVTLPRYAGIFLSLTDHGSMRAQTIDDENIEALAQWLITRDRRGT
jgi:restriction system protein